jgi:hypothetical protein
MGKFYALSNGHSTHEFYMGRIKIDEREVFIAVKISIKILNGVLVFGEVVGAELPV